MRDRCSNGRKEGMTKFRRGSGGLMITMIR